MLIPRTFSELITYFIDQVSEMNIPMKFREDLLGMISAVETRHEQDMPKWIPCSERLPERTAWILVSTRKGFVLQTWYDIEDTDDSRPWKTLANIDYPNDEILAWMELPKPWEGDANGKER